MGKPTITTHTATNTIEALNTNLDNIASRFDGNIDDTDVNAISWSKLTVSDDIVNADINSAAAIAGSKLADGAIATLQLAANAVTIAKITSGTNFKLQGEATDAAVTAGSHPTDQVLSTLSVQSAEDTNGKYVAFGVAEIARTGNSGRVTMGLSLDGTPFTVRPTYYLDGNAQNTPKWCWVMAHGALTTSAVDLTLICKDDGTLNWSHTAGNGYLMVLTFNRIG